MDIAQDADLQICATCGTQFDAPLTAPPGIPNCKICDDPRQYVPPGGQKWTCLKKLWDEKHELKFKEDEDDKRVISIWTEPKADIGQRCFLLQTEHGNVLWDLITYIDEDVYDFIKLKGGLKAIVISHPHYYTTHLTWAQLFNCPIHIAAEDDEWTVRPNYNGARRLIAGSTEEIVPGVTAIKCGGHFPGSLVLHWEKKLFIADTFKIVPSGLYHIDRPPGTTSFTFLWSYPNMIPLTPDAVFGIWKAIKHYEFDVTYDAFNGFEIKHPNVKHRVLESMKIQVKNSGWDQHEILKEEWDGVWFS